MKKTTPLFSLSLLLLFSGCFTSGPDESCEDHDRQANAEYLEQHAQNEDVTVTESGLQYRVLEPGEGPSPTAEDSVRVEFIGRLIDGSIFDTTNDVPGGLKFTIEDFSLEGVREGIQLMEEGSTYQFVVPTYLGFGETISGDICPGTTLIFELTLVEIFD